MTYEREKEDFILQELITPHLSIFKPKFCKYDSSVEDREAWCLQSIGLQRVRHNLVTEQQMAPQTIEYVWLFWSQLLSAHDKKLALEYKSSLSPKTLLCLTKFFNSKTVLMKEAGHWFTVWHEFLLWLQTENKYFVGKSPWAGLVGTVSPGLLVQLWLYGHRECLLKIVLCGGDS